MIHRYEMDNIYRIENINDIENGYRVQIRFHLVPHKANLHHH